MKKAIAIILIGILLLGLIILLASCIDKEIISSVVVDKDYSEEFTWIQYTPMLIGDCLFIQNDVMIEPARYWVVLDVHYADGTADTIEQTVSKEVWEQVKIGEEWKCGD